MSIRRVGVLGFSGVASYAAKSAYDDSKRPQDKISYHDLRALARTDETRTVFEPSPVVPSLQEKSNETKIKSEEDEYDACSVSSEAGSEKSTGILDGQLGFDNLGRLTLPINFFRSFSTTPPSNIEAESVFETIHENPDVLSSLVPEGFQELTPEQKQEIFGEARSCVTNPDFLSQVREKIEGKKAERNAALANKDDHYVSPASSTASDSHSEYAEGWEKLKEKYPCAICQDVLSGPEILNCSHTFCGYCVQSMVDRCSCEDDLEVVHTCPLCTTPIEYRIEERMMAANIEEEVQRFPQEFKAHWNERRRAIVKLREKKDRRQKAAQERETRNQEESEWSQQLAFWVPVLAVAAMIVLVFVRSGK